MHTISVRQPIMRGSLQLKRTYLLLSVCFIMIVLSVLSHGTLAQAVHTLPIKGLNGPNGFALDKTGALYVANEPGKQVLRIINDSIVERVLECDSPCGLDFDNDDNLYIINFFSGVVLRKSKNSVDTFATGLDQPADIKWDGKQNFYVSEYEKGTIKKMSMKGELSIFISGLKKPFGLTLDNDGNLYVASNATGEIDKIDTDGKLHFFAQIPGAASYIGINKNSGKLYAPCFTCHKIFVIDKNGKTELLTGNDAGYKDGNLMTAQFNGPNSIVISANGDIYISEFEANRIRKITGIKN